VAHGLILFLAALPILRIRVQVEYGMTEVMLMFVRIQDGELTGKHLGAIVDVEPRNFY